MKVLRRAEFPPKSPSWHLMCINITGKQAPNKHLVKVTNQFGSTRLKTGAPNQFCLPSLKSLKTPPQFDPPAPGEVQPDHFTCYPVAPVGTAVFKPPTQIRVHDQFSQQPVNVQVGQPRELCVPTEKSINGTVAGPITNPAAHLLCFDVSQTPTITPIWDQNQFGAGQLNVGPTKFLCLPSFKTLIK